MSDMAWVVRDGENLGSGKGGWRRLQVARESLMGHGVFRWRDPAGQTKLNKEGRSQRDLDESRGGWSRLEGARLGHMRFVESRPKEASRGRGGLV